MGNGNFRTFYTIYCGIVKHFSVSTDYLLGVEKTSSIDISGLTEKDIEMVYSLAEYLKTKNQEISTK